MITRPLTHLLKKGVYECNSAAQSAFEDLKQAMISAPVLKLPDFNKEFTIETYASGGGIGAALEKWRGYLLDRHFKIKTDHISLKYLVDQRMSTPTQLKCLPKLIGFDFEIMYKKGVDTVTTDALSRMQNLRELLSIMGTSTLQSSSNEHGHYTWHNEQLGRKGKLMVGNDEVVRKELLQHGPEPLQYKPNGQYSCICFHLGAHGPCGDSWHFVQRACLLCLSVRCDECLVFHLINRAIYDYLSLCLGRYDKTSHFPDNIREFTQPIFSTSSDSSGNTYTSVLVLEIAEKEFRLFGPVIIFFSYLLSWLKQHLDVPTLHVGVPL
ncbi:putative mitochondrial protein [Tanacetum coccineum]|uniref:Mitochondrial protein n=1 Tax=Tanacetum coccineum TaxID=301880 RepID=A0ABQ5FUC3_9ASTR